ncbi:MAG: pyridoxamine 5'-phosphate oxidase family protein [Pseudomonadota bacterium]
MVSIARIDQGELTGAALDKVLNARVSATLAFLDRDGCPRQFPCWYVWHDDSFCTTSDPDKYHVRCLRRDPRASMCVEYTEGELPPRAGDSRVNWQVKGHGAVTIEPDTDSRIWRLIRERYLGAVPSETETSDRLVLRLRPTKLAAHGGTMHFSP